MKRRKRNSKKWKRHSKKIDKPIKRKVDFFVKSKHKQISSSNEFGLCDDPSPVPTHAYIDVTDKSKWIAIVTNKEAKEVSFTPIDHCIEYEYKNPDKRCDGVLTYKSHIAFVELKQIKGRKSGDWIEPVEQQLKQTIFHFSKTQDSKLFKNKEAYIVNNKRPIFTKGQEVRTNLFYKETGYVLRIQCEILIK